MPQAVKHPNLDELDAGLDDIRAAPRDAGELFAIVVRPAENQRTELDECELSPELGTHGDNWGKGERQTLADGSPKRDVQITIMSTRVANLVAGSRERWALAGDNLYVDMDLSEENLPPGQKLTLGTAMLEITEVPHRGCKKFVERFGAEALRFISKKELQDLRLRGVYAQVVRAGSVKVGDRLEKS